MMRSLYSGVAGLRTHQTKMDVLGNNIANVNTTSYKSQSITFSDLMYQTTQTASGATATKGGVNARQIGLGAKSGAISTAIESQGATQTWAYASISRTATASPSTIVGILSPRVTRTSTTMSTPFIASTPPSCSTFLENNRYEKYSYHSFMPFGTSFCLL